MFWTHLASQMNPKICCISDRNRSYLSKKQPQITLCHIIEQEMLGNHNKPCVTTNIATNIGHQESSGHRNQKSSIKADAPARMLINHALM